MTMRNELHRDAFPPDDGSAFFGEPMVSKNGEPAVIGRQIQLAVQPDGATFVAQPTQLISHRQNAPRQWVITIAQALVGPNGVTPWQVPTASEGSNVAPGPGTEVPRTSGSNPMQVALRWGAGGAAFLSRFDYPLAGATFGLTADTVDVNVVFRDAPLAYAAMAIVPVVGAFMVPGLAADPSPLRWYDNPGIVAAGDSGYWSVKPYARRVRVLISAANAVDSYVAFREGIGGILMQQSLIAGRHALEIPVPAQASVFEYFNNGAVNVSVQVEWQIGLT